jgi:RHS repeat-associated protein
VTLPFGNNIGNTRTPDCTPVVGNVPDATEHEFTGKERDTESGLDYFGARYNSSSMGRFMSPDPSNLSVDQWLPQTWNRYSYALNNPLNMVDRNGLWPWWIHDEIYEQAFPGMSKQDLENVKDASFVMDYAPGQQDPSNAYMHGMSDGSGTVFYGGGNGQHAWEQAENYIDSQVEAAQSAQANWIAQGHTGLSPLALSAFGNALHTVTDRTSPSHEGEQPWSNKFWPGVRHVIGELHISNARQTAATNASRALFQRTFGDEFDWMLQKEPCFRTSTDDGLGNRGSSGCQ